MCFIPFALWISNAAARFSGIRGAVSIQAQRFPEEPKHLQDKDLRVHYFVKKSLSWYAPNIRP